MATPRCGPAATRRAGWAGWTSPASSSASRRRAAPPGGRRRGPTGLTRSSARHGRIEPRPGGAGRDFPAGAPACAARPRLDGPRRGARGRGIRRPERTLFFVSSKSGSTLEPNILKRYFCAKVRDAVGQSEAGRRFVAITDPGSPSSARRERDGFRKVISRARVDRRPLFRAVELRHGARRRRGRGRRRAARARAPRGRGMRPDARRRRTRAWCWARCSASARMRGRDKLTLVRRPRIADFGAWLEQLAGGVDRQGGKGRRFPSTPSRWARRRPMAMTGCSRTCGSPPNRIPPRTPRSDGLAEAGHPVVRIDLADALDLGGQFFVWEFATAVVGALLGVNPFDQPDVEASKVRTRELTDRYEQTGDAPRRGADPGGGGPVRVRRRAQRRRARRAHARSTRCWRPTSVASTTGTTSPCCPTSSARPSTSRRCVRSAPWCATAPVRRPVWGSGRGSCTPRGRPTRAARTPACSCRSRATTSVDLDGSRQRLLVRGREGGAGAGRPGRAGRAGRRALRLHIGLDVEAGLRSLGGAVTRALSA